MTKPSKAAAVALVLLLTGCGSSAPAPPSTGNDSYREVTITVGGHPLRCVERTSYSAISCDWQGWHNQ